ncbi:hypothetical protein F383_22249 [Gossypium arboreum]|uniref:Uncharacterized protein n=1 Tax=Gossypium arboreum TaxID=29729 RepID=A0A0B0NXZ1_GOSAR|nr:hypothetical protein F383_22249 [Gossypium arboreum]
MDMRVEYMKSKKVLTM